MEYIAALGHALISPVNCVGNYANAIMGATGQFIQCVGSNLVGVTTSTSELANATVNAVTSIGA